MSTEEQKQEQDDLTITYMSGYYDGREKARKEFAEKNAEKDAEKKRDALILEDVISICESIGDKGLDGHYCADAIAKKYKMNQWSDV